VRGNSHARFLGGRGRATARAYPVHHDALVHISHSAPARVQHEFAFERVHVSARIQQSWLCRYAEHIWKDDGHSVLDGQVSRGQG